MTPKQKVNNNRWSKVVVNYVDNHRERKTKI